MMKVIKKILFSIIVGLWLANTAQASALSDVNLNQLIVPINCVFEVVSTGPYQVIWITPEECEGAVVPTYPEPTKPTPSRPVIRPGVAGSTTTQDPAPSTPPDSTVNPSTGIIKLNIYPEYRKEQASNGKELELKSGQVVYFDLNKITYSVTVREVGFNAVKITLLQVGSDGKSVSRVIKNDELIVSSNQQYDVDGDGSPDIRIGLREVKDGVAVITFKELDNSKIEPESGHKCRCHCICLLILLLILLIIFLLIWRRHRKNQAKKKSRQARR